MADGGEGTMEAILAASQGELRRQSVRGPLGEHVEAGWGWLPQSRTAIIEMAQASGLQRVPTGQRDACRSSTYGTGQLIGAALGNSFLGFALSLLVISPLLDTFGVKRTVLFDGTIPVYHLYYGSPDGDASTIITTFPFKKPGIFGKRGTNQAECEGLMYPLVGNRAELQKRLAAGIAAASRAWFFSSISGF